MAAEDRFALLGMPRRPWLDTSELKQRFLDLSSQVHPDRFHDAGESERGRATQQYAGLNAAYQTLREPKERLLHLYELEAGGAPRDIQRIPPGTMDLFVEVGQTCRDIDEFLQQRNSATSPLMKVQFFAKTQEWIGRVNELQKKVSRMHDLCVEELKPMNEIWARMDKECDSDRHSRLPLSEVERIYRTLSYTSRWSGQLQSRQVELMA